MICLNDWAVDDERCSARSMSSNGNVHRHTRQDRGDRRADLRGDLHDRGRIAADHPHGHRGRRDDKLDDPPSPAGTR